MIIRGEVASKKFVERWDIDTLVERCGDMKPNFGIRVLSFLETLDPTQYAHFDQRLTELSGGMVDLPKLKKAMRGEDGFTTLAEYVNSPHFRGAVAESQTPEKGKDWMHPGDYLLPVSVHSIPVSDCQAMIDDMISIQKTHGRFEYAGAINADKLSNLFTTYLFFMFLGPDRSRAYNPHRHGVPNHTLMLQVKGYKHAVVWPNNESPNLYQVMDLLPDKNEVGEFPAIYQVDGFVSDFAKQPDLAKVMTSWEGVAAPGDLMYIPCGIPHTVENRGESLALGWFPSGDDMAHQAPSVEPVYTFEERRERVLKG